MNDFDKTEALFWADLTFIVIGVIGAGMVLLAEMVK